jgi:hypothetical protein
MQRDNSKIDVYFEKYMKPLLKQLALSEIQPEFIGCEKYYEAQWENVSIRLDNHRGLGCFSLSSCHKDGEYREVELVAPLLIQRPIRGSLRLSLEDQANFIAAHWEELQKLFSKEQLMETYNRINKGQ